MIESYNMYNVEKQNHEKLTIKIMQHIRLIDVYFPQESNYLFWVWFEKKVRKLNTIIPQLSLILIWLTHMVMLHLEQIV